jgi:2,3-dihydroxybiphenyl 1,2-dioxygenase
VAQQLQLAYIGIEVPDPNVLTPTFGDVVGLLPGESPDGHARTWRNDNRVHRVILQAGPANDAIYFGVEATDSESFEEVATRLDRAGFALDEGTAEDRIARRVGELGTTTTPWGVNVEVVTGLASTSDAFSSPGVPGGFLTDGVGFGHAVFVTTAFDESHAFVVDALGFSQSDWLVTEIAEGIELEVRFYHCNQRHHTLALARAPFELPQKLHHVMFEMNDRDDVGKAFDRAWASDLSIPNGLGRHDNDGMFSFYMGSPAGFQIEVGHGARVVTDDWDDNRAYDRISAWGHQALR